jgi:predicted PurR-regulated permease PerM
MDPTLAVIIIFVAVVLLTGFSLLVFSLVPTINQLRSLLADLEKTSSEARDLVTNLKSVSGKVDTDLEKVDKILEATNETVTTVKESLKFVNTKVLKQSAGLLALIPAIKFGWDLIKKFRKGGHHE